MVIATQLFAGPHPQPRDIVDLVEAERVTVVGGVPTIWLGVKEICQFGARILHAWGMTETTPIGTVSRLKSYMEIWPEAQQYAVCAKQGYAAVGVDLRLVDEQGCVVPWDGSIMGEIRVRSPWITSGYYHLEAPDRFSADSWFKTGDIATIDPEGYIQIMDRTKDVIKSGGEWISSVDLENTIMAHSRVLEAAVIAVPHPTWVERPLACVVPKPEYCNSLTAADMLAFLRPRVAKFWLPDAVAFLEAVPKTSVGKFDKNVLRERFKDWQPPA